MPRKEGQKRKLLVLLEILARETDENHLLSVPRIVELLQARGIDAERKSVYDDIQTLNEIPESGFEIVQQRGRGGGYYMTDAPFELAELKMLVDAVYASKFITARKSRTLIEKLGRFTSRYRQETLDRKVLVMGRIKSTDERILYTVDALHNAITNGVQVQFKYCDWNLQKKMEPRHGGA
ncbi:MAG: helix-turn-helix transcriptional regulator, partial [Gemmiger sp.]